MNKYLAAVENLDRSKRRLLKNRHAFDWVLNEAVIHSSCIDKFHIGLAATKNNSLEECQNKLVIPIIGNNGKPGKRRLYYRFFRADITAGNNDWQHTGKPLVYYSANCTNKKNLFICSDIFDVWILDSFLPKNLKKDFVFACVTKRGVSPEDFKDALFWKRFSNVYFGHRSGLEGNASADELSKICGRDIFRVTLPEQFVNWREFVRDRREAGEFFDLLTSSKSISSNTPMFNQDALLGEFPIAPVNCNGAYVGGYMYYPYRIERREIEKVKHRDGTVSENLVSSYQTKVVRSDGSVLDIGYLSAPRGTPPNERVLTLSDGTRIESVPNTNLHATWHLDSIKDFVSAKQNNKKAPHRALNLILLDIVNHYRQSVWLPVEEDYIILALYTTMSFVYNIFEAIPLLLIYGEKGSGKTELGNAIEQVSFNSMIIGQGSAASVIRILHESRGLVVLDDLEGIKSAGDKQSFNEIHQMLKLSYKKKTSKKTVTEKNGRTFILDFFGPKVITNTRGTDSILSSRMIKVDTRRIPYELRRKVKLPGSDPEVLFALRNELHVWAMSSASHVERIYKELFSVSVRDRSYEIFLPLETIALLSENKVFTNSVKNISKRRDLSEVVPIDTRNVLEEAIKTLILDGYLDEVALPHLQLQMANIIENSHIRLASVISEWKYPQWVGSNLEKGQLRDKNIKVRRSRLYGKETRIYRINPEIVKSILQTLLANQRIKLKSIAKTPFTFCEKVVCIDCKFSRICEETIPNLMQIKRKWLLKHNSSFKVSIASDNK